MTLRHPRTGFVRGGVGYCDGANHFFQHLTAMGMKRALCRVTRECYDPTLRSPLFGCRVVACIHDELLLEAPEEVSSLAARRLSAVMVEEMKVFLPDVPVSAESALMRRWRKAAEPVEKDGRLIPWEDRDLSTKDLKLLKDLAEEGLPPLEISIRVGVEVERVLALL